jgi:site-specific recombinase XerD
MKAKNESIAMAKFINSFLNNNITLSNTCSYHTVKSYKDSMSLFLYFLETVKDIRSETLCGDCFSVSNIEEWLTWLQVKRSNDPATCNIRLAGIRSFLKFLGKKDVSYLYLSQASSQIKLRKVVKKKVKGISKPGIQALLASPDHKSKVGRRDITLMVVLYSTAARLNEILSIKIKHISLHNEKPSITIVGKGNKIRTLYLTPKSVSHLEAYIREFHGDSPNPSAFLFYSRNSGLFGMMSQTAVAKQLRKHAKIAHTVCTDVPLDLHAHQIRHAKATHWLEDGMNIVQISFLLGHSNLQTTMTYLDITTENQQKALATLEDENEKDTPKIWRSNDNDLASLCGVRKIREYN